VREGEGGEHEAVCRWGRQEYLFRQGARAVCMCTLVGWLYNSGRGAKSGQAKPGGRRAVEGGEGRGMP